MNHTEKCASPELVCLGRSERSEHHDRLSWLAVLLVYTDLVGIRKEDIMYCWRFWPACRTALVDAHNNPGSMPPA